LAPGVEGLEPFGTGPLLGSVSANNLQVREHRGALRLAAILDLESVRVGPRGFDQAMLWYDLISLHHLTRRQISLVEAWFRCVAEFSDAAVLRGLIANAAWFSAFRVKHRHPERDRDAELRPMVREALMSLRARWLPC
jgi:Ser/Thr protein kinase RdoA (MazF antagonist)